MIKTTTLIGDIGSACSPSEAMREQENTLARFYQGEAFPDMNGSRITWRDLTDGQQVCIRNEAQTLSVWFTFHAHRVIGIPHGRLRG